MDKAQEVIDQWPTFASAYDLDSDVGILIKPDYKITSFNFSQLQDLIVKLKTLTQTEDLKNFFQTFPELQLKKERSNRDMVILHGHMAFVLEKFIDYFRKINKDLTGAILPKGVAVPLYESSKQLQTSYGMTYGVQYNWTLPKELDYNTLYFSYDDFEITNALTNNYPMQKLFFGGSLIGSFQLGKIIRLIYEMNAIIEHAPMEQEQVLRRLEEIKKRWQKVIQPCSRIMNELDGKYFSKDLVVMVEGFRGLIFEGVDNGENKTLDAGRGSGGSDSSFQIFERGFGVQLEGSIIDGQARLRGNMIKTHRALIDHMSQKSLIREYCNCTLKLTKAYNQVLAIYSDFLFMHQNFISKFVLSQNVIPEHLKQGQEMKKLFHEIKGFLSHYEQVKAAQLPTKDKI